MTRSIAVHHRSLISLLFAALAVTLVLFSCSSPGVPETSGSGGAGSSCTQGLAECSGSCSNLQADPAHCGGCSTACQIGQECRAGACSCIAPLSSCGGSCVNLQ